MTNIEETLRLHKLWLENDSKGVRAYLTGADLTGADLTGADLRGADLRGADLTGAYLTRAYLRGADLDFSCLPLHCGGLNFKVDEKIIKQLLYHVINIADYSDIKIPQLGKNTRKFANKFHRVISTECKEV